MKGLTSWVQDLGNGAGSGRVYDLPMCLLHVVQRCSGLLYTLSDGRKVGLSESGDGTIESTVIQPCMGIVDDKCCEGMS